MGKTALPELKSKKATLADLNSKLLTHHASAFGVKRHSLRTPTGGSLKKVPTPSLFSKPGRNASFGLIRHPAARHPQNSSYASCTPTATSRKVESRKKSTLAPPAPGELVMKSRNIVGYPASKGSWLTRLYPELCATVGTPVGKRTGLLSPIEPSSGRITRQEIEGPRTSGRKQTRSSARKEIEGNRLCAYFAKPVQLGTANKKRVGSRKP